MDTLESELAREVRRVLNERKADWIERGRTEGRLAVYAELAVGRQPVLKAMPDDEGDPHDAIAEAMVEHAHQCKTSGEDPTPGMEALRALLDDPEALAVALQGSVDEGTVAKAVGLMVVRKAKWDSSAHPRGKNGHFISKDSIEEAKSDPEKAKALREQVKPEDAAKLDKQLGEAPKGPSVTQKRGEAAERGKKILGKLAKAADLRGKLTADDLHALADHLSDPAVTVSHLREVRQAMRDNALRAGFGGGKRKEEMVKALVEHARGHAEGARAKEEAGAKEPTDVRYGSGVKDVIPGSRPDLDHAEKQAIGQYTNLAYKSLNAQLRDSGEPSAQNAKTHEEMQKAFAKAKPFESPVQVQRALNIDGPDGEQFVELAKQAMASGGVATMPGYVSTTRGDHAGDLFKHADVNLTVNAVHGLDVSPYSASPHEKELLLNHDSRFRVKKVEKVDGKWHIELDQLPPSDKTEPTTSLNVKRKEYPEDAGADMELPDFEDAGSPEGKFVGDDSEGKAWGEAFEGASLSAKPSQEATPTTPPEPKTVQQIADEITARRKQQARPAGADDANPTDEEFEAASRPGKNLTPPEPSAPAQPSAPATAPDVQLTNGTRVPADSVRGQLELGSRNDTKHIDGIYKDGKVEHNEIYRRLSNAYQDFVAAGGARSKMAVENYNKSVERAKGLAKAAAEHFAREGNAEQAKRYGEDFDSLLAKIGEETGLSGGQPGKPESPLQRELREHKERLAKESSAPPAADPALDMGGLLDQPANAVTPGSRTGEAVARAEGQQAKRTGVPTTDIASTPTAANNPGIKTAAPPANGAHKELGAKLEARNRNTKHSEANAMIRQVANLTDAQAAELIKGMGQSPTKDPKRQLADAIADRQFSKVRALDTRGNKDDAAFEKQVSDEPLLSADDVLGARAAAKPAKTTRPVAGPTPKPAATPKATPPATPGGSAVVGTYGRAASASDADIETAKAHLAKMDPDELSRVAASMGWEGPATAKDLVERIEDRRGSAVRRKLIDRPTPEPSTPAKKVADDSPGGLSGVLASHGTATGKAKDAIDAALWNAGVEDPTKPGAAKTKVDPNKLARTLAGAWHDNHDDMTPQEREQVQAALAHAGVQVKGTPGEQTAFDGRYHEGAAGHFTGDKTTVTRPGLVHVGEDGVERVLVKGQTAKKGKPPVAKNTQTPPSTATSSTAEATAKVKHLYDNVALDKSVSNDELRKHVSDAVSHLPKSALDDVVKQLGYAVKPKSKEDALAKISSHVSGRRGAFGRAEAAGETDTPIPKMDTTETGPRMATVPKVVAQPVTAKSPAKSSPESVRAAVDTLKQLHAVSTSRSETTEGLRKKATEAVSGLSDSGLYAAVKQIGYASTPKSRQAAIAMLVNHVVARRAGGERADA